jgi:hypothetical protein
VFRSTSAAASAPGVDADVVEGNGDWDSRATPGCEGRRPEVARGLAVDGEGGEEEEKECPVCAVVLKVSPAEDVVRYDSWRTSTRVPCCGGPEDKDVDEGGSGVLGWIPLIKEGA